MDDYAKKLSTAVAQIELFDTSIFPEVKRFCIAHTPGNGILRTKPEMIPSLKTVFHSNIERQLRFFSRSH